MKRNLVYFISFWLIIVATMLLSSCANSGGSSSDPSADKTCQEGICLEITITQPIVLNQPTDVTIKISSTVDTPGLLINLQASPTNVTFGSNSNWQYDAFANQSQEFHSTIKFSSTGGWTVAAVVFSPKGGPIVSNQDRVVIDVSGAVVNPTINPNPTSDLFIINTPIAPQQLTATAKALPTLPPLPQVEGFTPQEWLQKCGWTVEKPDTISMWPDISGWLNIRETAVIGKQATGTLMIGFKDINNPDVTIQAKIGLCPVGKGWKTESTHEWNTELRSAKPFEAPVSLSFTGLGEIPVFIVALDTQNNRVAGIGRLIFVKADAQSSIPLPPTPILLDNGWYLYTDPDLGFSFAYPPTAHLDAGNNSFDSSKNITIQFLLPEKPYQGMSMRLESNPNHLSGVEYAKQLVETSTQKQAPIEFLNSIKTITFGNLPAIEVPIPSMNAETTVIVPFGEKVLILSPVHGAAVTNVENETLELFYKILGSFKFNISK